MKLRSAAPTFACAFAIFGLCAVAAGIPTAFTPIAHAAPPSTAPAVNAISEAEMKDMIGRTVRDEDGATLGLVKSIMIGKSGQAVSVIMHYGNREVAVNMSEIDRTRDGDLVTHLSRNTLADIPTYKYKQAGFRGTVFHDSDL